MTHTMTHLLLACGALAAVAVAPAAALPYSASIKTFGHSVKNGPLPAYPAEVTAFAHNCTAAPCTITQLHVPSIYPGSGTGGWDWQNGRIAFYVDGEASPSINITLLELAWVSKWASIPGASNSGGKNTFDNRGLPWGVEQFGHTATSGGVYSTVRIPFGKSIRVTIQAPPVANGKSIYWMIVRGLEAFPVDYGGVVLPNGARLKVYRNEDVQLADKELVTLGQAAAGTAGAIVGTKLDAVGYSEGYLEACMRFYPTAAEAAGTNPIFLSSGAEDYFLSASYFDEGMFVTPNSGLTFKDGGGGIGAYKMHDLRDMVFFDDGFKMQFRAGEDTTGCGDELHCPNQFCEPNASPTYAPVPDADLPKRASKAGFAAAMAMGATDERPEGTGGGTGADAADAGCSVGAVSQGFDRPGGDEWCFSMNQSTGVLPTDCAAQCCNNTNCVAWVHVDHFHSPYQGCAGNGGPCCWLKNTALAIVKHSSQGYNISTGEVAGHGAACKGGGPGGGGGGAGSAAPPAPKGPAGKTLYSTLLYTYEWPKEAAQAQAKAPAPPPSDDAAATTAAIKTIRQLVAAGFLTRAASDAAIDMLVLGEAAPAARAGLLALLAAAAADGELTRQGTELVARFLSRHAAGAV